MNWISSNLKFLRRQANLTQIEAAKQLGLKTGTYEYWEYTVFKTNTNAAKWLKISLKYQVSIDYLVRRDLSKISTAQIRINYMDIQDRLAEIDKLSK